MDENEMKLEFLSKSNNESFARIAVAAFVSQLDPTIEEISDIKTAVSEYPQHAAGSHPEGRKQDPSVYPFLLCLQAAVDRITERGRGSGKQYSGKYFRNRTEKLHVRKPLPAAKLKEFLQKLKRF